jgi:outer membrane lipoprotein-sorting protein
MYKAFQLIISSLFIFISSSLKSDENIKKIFSYLENFSSLKSDFIQINNNGNILTGKIFLSRPGKIRIEYNENPLVVISDGKKVATVNKKLKNVTFYSLNDIPIKMLLYKDFDLNTIKILNYREKDNNLFLNLTENKFAEQGFVEIIFEKNPFQMKKWTVISNDQSKTEILLNNLEFNSKIEKNKFDISEEDPRNQLWRN